MLSASMAAGNVEFLSREELRGWACPTSTGPATVELSIDGALVARGRADQPRADLAALDLGRSDFGFALALPGGLQLDLARLRVTVRETGDVLPVAPDAAGGEGVVEHVAGGLIGGWAWRVGRPGQRVLLAVCDRAGEPMAKLIADLPRPDLAAAGIGDGAHGFMIDCSPLVRGMGMQVGDLHVRFDETQQPLPDLSSLPRTVAPRAPVAAPIAVPAPAPAPVAQHPVASAADRVVLAMPTSRIELTEEAVDAIRGALGMGGGGGVAAGR